MVESYENPNVAGEITMNGHFSGNQQFSQVKPALLGVKLLNHQFERFHGDVSSSAVASGSGTGGAAPNLVTDRNLFPGFDVVPISSCLNCSISWGVAIRPHTPV